MDARQLSCDVCFGRAADYYDQVIYVESLLYRAHWLDAHHSKVARFTQTPESNVVNVVWPKWKLKKGPDNTILLESVLYPNHFLDAHHSGTCHVTYSAYPYSHDWALWYMERTEKGNFAFRSKLYSNSRLDAHHSGEAHITYGSGVWSEMRVYQPDVSEERELIFIYDNTCGTSPVDTSYTEKIGISQTNTQSTSTTISTEIGAEIEGIFTAKTSVSATWSQSSSSTWSTEQSRTVSVTVNPGTVKKIYQLVGYYNKGPNGFKIASNHLFFEG